MWGYLEVSKYFGNAATFLGTYLFPCQEMPRHYPDATSSHEKWITDRSIALICPGAPNLLVPVSVGVPQDSPISPLFFVIYAAPLHAPDGISFRLSYVDDFSLTVTSTSYEQNSQKLCATFDFLVTQGTSISAPFAPETTEVIHWETHRQRSPAPSTPIQLGGQQITPSASVRWLGFWFDQRRTGTVQVCYMC